MPKQRANRESVSSIPEEEAKGGVRERSPKKSGKRKNEGGLSLVPKKKAKGEVRESEPEEGVT